MPPNAIVSAEIASKPWRLGAFIENGAVPEVGIPPILNDKFNDNCLDLDYNTDIIADSERMIMLPTIDRIRTGQQLRLLIAKRGFTIRDVQEALGLGCVQSVYHWLDGQSIPTIDNLYALSDLLKVPIDMMVCGNRQYDPLSNFPAFERRIFHYYLMTVA